MRLLQHGASVKLHNSQCTTLRLQPRNRCAFLLLLLVLLWQVTSTKIHASPAYNTTERNITRYPDVNHKRNPYDEGCLYSYGLQDIQRTCNSEDTDTTKCSSNDLNYMEIRIHTGDWESITYESWIIQILLSEILHVPTTIDAGLGNVESLNFFHSEGGYG